jgi:hypothetical protein
MAAPIVYANEQFFYGEKGLTGIPAQIVRVTSASHNRKTFEFFHKLVKYTVYIVNQYKITLASVRNR